MGERLNAILAEEFALAILLWLLLERGFGLFLVCHRGLVLIFRNFVLCILRCNVSVSRTHGTRGTSLVRFAATSRDSEAQHPLPSVSSQVGVLAHYQPLDVKPSCHIPRAIAKEILRRLMAEPVTAKVIRMFPPDSTFPVLKPLQPSVSPFHAAEPLPPREVPNCYFQLPQSDTWRIQHRTVSFMPSGEVTACGS